MNWLRRFMYGRNGPDHLGYAILIFGLVLTLVAGFIPVPAVRAVLNALNYLFLVLFIFRIISRNVYRRQQENMRFLAVLRRFTGWFRLRGRMLREARDYRYLKCPRCHQRLRVPRGRGRIRVNCAKCHEQFEVKV